MRPIILLILLFVILFLSHLTLAQSFNFKHYTVEHGLSQSQNKKVFLDSRGYLWFGSFEGGLSKFDGNTFTNYTEKLGLANNKVRTITEDLEGNLWIGTEEGISIFDGKKFKTVPGTENSPFSILSLAVDQNGIVWAGTQKNGLYYILPNHEAQKVELPPTLNTLSVRSIKIEHNKAYISSDGGFIVADISNSPEIKIDYLGLEKTGCSSFLKIKEDYFLLGSYEGLFIYEKGNIRPFDKNPLLDKADIKDLLKDSKGNIWIATYGDGLFLIEDFDFSDHVKMMRFGKKEGLLHSRVLSIEEDINGNIWLCTYAGVNKFLGQSFMHVTKDHGLPSNLVWDVKTDDQNNLWIAHNGGLSVFDGRKVKNFSEKDGFYAKKSSAIAFDKNNKMYIATNKGLYIYKNNKFFAPTFPGNPRYLDFTLLYIDRSNRLWVSGDEKVYTLDLNEPIGDVSHQGKHLSEMPEVKLFAESPSLGHSVINAIYQDAHGSIWFATDGGGLTVFDGKTFKRITKKDGLPSNTVNSILEDKSGNIWLATSLSGIVKISFLDRFSFQYKLYVISEEEGLASNNIYSMLSEDSVLWLGTEKGIHKITFNDNTYEEYNRKASLLKGMEIDFYGNEEGFTAIEANHKAVTKDINGNIWWGTIRGLTRYDPNYDNLNGSKINYHITDIDLFHEKVDWSEKSRDMIPWVGLPVNLKLPHNQNHITFKYAGINFRNSKNIKYKYFLEGFDKSFSPAQSINEAVYSNIPPGDYTFKLLSDAGKGTWDKEEMVSYTFTIEKPYWMTWWFIFICTSVGTGTFYALILGRVYQLKRQKLELARKVSERTFKIEQQKQEIEAQIDEIEAQRDQLASKTEFLESAYREIEKKNEQITSSINYAKRIQQAILPQNESIIGNFTDYFILNAPRDIVSGDFYWFSDKGKKIIACADCTGHGVPGAFMSMVGYSLLNQIINENNILQPSKILYHLNEGIKKAFRQELPSATTDGMDISVCKIDLENHTIEFSGAKRPLYLMKNKNLIEVKGNKFSIGGDKYSQIENFESNILHFESGDMLYMVTDGYADQFGGPSDKKLMTKMFKKMLINISHLDCLKQKEELETALCQWKKGKDQTDDILVIGLRL